MKTVLNNKNKGFTLAEMIIVVAIVGILVGIIVTSLGEKLEVAREGVDKANIKTAMEELTNASIEGKFSSDSGITYNKADNYYSKKIYSTQKKVGWQTENNANVIEVNYTKVSSNEGGEVTYYWEMRFYPEESTYSTYSHSKSE